MAKERGKLIGFRSDRMGGRLIAILNTMRFARSFDLPYVIHWRDSDGLGDGSELFEQGFIDRQFIGKRDYLAMKDSATSIYSVLHSTSPEEFLRYLDDGMHLLLDPPFDVLRLACEDEADVKSVFAEVVRDLPLNPVLRARIDGLQDSLRDGTRTVSYHIRRGDLTSDMRAMNRAWPNKFVPDELFESHIRANLEGSGTRTVLYSDNASVLSRYTTMFPRLQTFADIADTSDLTEVQRDATELFAMSLSDLIVAPPSSAFSSTASTIGGAGFRDVESELPPEARDAALDVLAGRLRNEPELFANEGEIGQYLVYACDYLCRTGRREEFIRIARQHIESGLNIAFVYAMTFREMYFAGQYQEICDLRKSVDRGYVAFQRSFAQVLLFHGLALLMLGRKPEAMRQITSAFWHEPVEGEINALIGLLRKQGDLHDGNFWPTDARVEMLFSNRFVVDHIRQYYTAPLQAGVLSFGGVVANSRVMVWEWPDFTRSDSRSHYKLQGHFRSILKVLNRRDWTPDLRPHFDSFHGMIMLREGRTDEAEPQILSALAAQPQNALFHKRLAELRHEQGRSAEALQALDRAIALAPGTPMYRILKGLYLFRQDDFGTAADLLVATMDQGDLHFPAIFFTAADAAVAAKRPDDAIRMLRAGLDLSPLNWRRQNELARLLAETGDRAGAMEVLDWALQWADDHPPLVMLNTDLLIREDRRDEACERLARLVAKYPQKQQYARRHAKLTGNR